MDGNFYNKVTLIISALILIGVLVFSGLELKFRIKINSKPKSTYSTTQYKT